MATINLKDKEGFDVDFGDLVIVTIPEIDIPPRGDPNDDHNFDGFYAAERIIQGTLLYRLSKGLFLKITGIIKDPENRHAVGQVIKFKVKKWHWVAVPF